MESQNGKTLIKAPPLILKQTADAVGNVQLSL